MTRPKNNTDSETELTVEDTEDFVILTKSKKTVRFSEEPPTIIESRIIPEDLHIPPSTVIDNYFSSKSTQTITPTHSELTTFESLYKKMFGMTPDEFLFGKDH